MKPSGLMRLLDDFNKAVKMGMPVDGLKEIHLELSPEDLCRGALSVRSWIDARMTEAINNAINAANRETEARTVEAHPKTVGRPPKAKTPV